MRYKRICICTLSFSLLLTGCRLVPSTYNNKNIKNTTEYYSKGEKVVISYDDVILTMYEKNIVSNTDIGKQYIKRYESIPIEYDSKWIDLLNINTNTLTNKYVVNNINKHSNNKYYDKSNNTIKWDILVDKVYSNSLGKEKTTDYIALSKAEIEIVLSQMNEFLDIVKEDYPTFDVANLACKLNNLSLVYFYREESDNAKASCVQDMIAIGMNPDGTKPNLDRFKGLIFHEFKHLFCFCCNDEMKDSYYTAGGISSKEGYDINLLFLEEALAEEYSSLKSDRDMTCYYNQYNVLNTLRLVLSLQDDYDENNFFKYQLLHNPIALLQQFPVYDNEDIYYRNITMLECFNELLMNSDSYQNSLNKYVTNRNGINFVKQDAYQSLFNYSMCQLNRMFYSNLISLNEKYDVSLDYNLYLINIYKEQAYNNIKSLCSIDLDKSIYNNNLKECNDLFIDYYSNKKDMDKDYINQYSNEYVYRIPNSFPTYITEDKIRLYNYLYCSKYKGNVLVKK